MKLKNERIWNGPKYLILAEIFGQFVWDYGLKHDNMALASARFILGLNFHTDLMQYCKTKSIRLFNLDCIRKNRAHQKWNLAGSWLANCAIKEVSTLRMTPTVTLTLNIFTHRASYIIIHSVWLFFNWQLPKMSAVAKRI